MSWFLFSFNSLVDIGVKGQSGLLCGWQVVEVGWMYWMLQAALLWGTSPRGWARCRGDAGSPTPTRQPPTRASRSYKLHPWPCPLEPTTAHHQYWRLEDLAGLLTGWIWCIVARCWPAVCTVRHSSSALTSSICSSPSLAHGCCVDVL